MGRLVVDTHVHAQRFAMSAEFRDAAASSPMVSYNDLADEISRAAPYDNSHRLVADMGVYGVDMAILLPAFGMTNDLNVEIIERHPGRFAAVCAPVRTARRALVEGIPWSAAEAAREIDDLLASGKFVGTGEGFPADSTRRRTISQTERMDQIRPLMEVASRHRTVVRMHTGVCCGYPLTHHFWPETLHPAWVMDLAVEYPQVPIVLDHGGVQGWWSTRFVDEALLAAAANDNVYLETGLWWSDLYGKALSDPNIGAEKLIWGCDWGSSIPFHTQPGGEPPVYAVQKRNEPPPNYQVDVWGWSLKQLLRLDVAQDDLNLILGGNAARIYGLPLPHTRMFPPVSSSLRPQWGERPAAYLGASQ
ncbi:MAG: amidohydrolase family protein [Acidimicrobiia bacterium]